jgi:serine/threonine-protein kinase
MPFDSLGPGRSITTSPKATVYAGVVGGLLSVERDASRSQFVRFVDRFSPAGLAMNQRGDLIYMTDAIANRVATVPPGGDTPRDLPFPGLSSPTGIAVDSNDAVYVADTGNNRVMRLDAGAPVAVDMAIPDLREPTGLAVNSTDDIFVGSANGVVKMPADSSAPEKLKGASTDPRGMAVDVVDDVYVADPTTKKVTRYSGVTHEWADVPFTGLDLPNAVAVDRGGAVYVVDKDRVLKLPRITR